METKTVRYLPNKLEISYFGKIISLKTSRSHDSVQYVTWGEPNPSPPPLPAAPSANERECGTVRAGVAYRRCGTVRAGVASRVTGGVRAGVM